MPLPDDFALSLTIALGLDPRKGLWTPDKLLDLVRDRLAQPHQPQRVQLLYEAGSELAAVLQGDADASGLKPLGYTVKHHIPVESVADFLIRETGIKEDALPALPPDDAVRVLKGRALAKLTPREREALGLSATLS